MHGAIPNSCYFLISKMKRYLLLVLLSGCFQAAFAQHDMSKMPGMNHNAHTTHPKDTVAAIEENDMSDMDLEDMKMDKMDMKMEGMSSALSLNLSMTRDGSGTAGYLMPRHVCLYGQYKKVDVHVSRRYICSL